MNLDFSKSVGATGGYVTSRDWVATSENKGKLRLQATSSHVTWL